MPKISIVIMAHSSRAKYFPYLKLKLGDIPFSIDRAEKEIGIWQNCRRAWLMHDMTSDYAITIQDDAIIGNDFIKRAEKIMTKDMVYNFYLGRPRFKKIVNEARKRGKEYIIKKNIHHEIALGFPTKRVKEMVEFCDRFNPTHDRYINRYVNEKALKVYFPMPSLIDHRAGKSLHKLNKGHYIAKATWFIGE